MQIQSLPITTGKLFFFAIGTESQMKILAIRKVSQKYVSTGDS